MIATHPRLPGTPIGGLLVAGLLAAGAGPVLAQAAQGVPDCPRAPRAILFELQD